MDPREFRNLVIGLLVFMIPLLPVLLMAMPLKEIVQALAKLLL